MTIHYEGPRESRRAQEYTDPYQELDEAVQERYGFGYQTYYMRRLIAAEHVLFAKRQAAMTWNRQEQAHLHETAERWEHILLSYCEEDLLRLEEDAATSLGQSWMKEARSKALRALGPYDAQRS